MLTIRASMLPAWPDCPRRAATKQFRSLIEQAGHELRTLKPSVGAAVGTATHSIVAARQRARIVNTIPTIAEAVDVAFGVFRDEIKHGAEWDATTPNVQAAEAQIARMAEAALVPAREREPEQIEVSLRAAINEDWTLTGTLDERDTNGHIEDLKTGALERPYQAQLGAYSLLARSNGLPVTSISTTYIARAALKKPQPPARHTAYDLRLSEQAAHAAITTIVRDVTTFQQTGDPWAFPANPMSLMCSARYCAAHGTSFCGMHLSTSKPDVD